MACQKISGRMNGNNIAEKSGLDMPGANECHESWAVRSTQSTSPQNRNAFGILPRADNHGRITLGLVFMQRVAFSRFGSWGRNEWWKAGTSITFVAFFCQSNAAETFHGEDKSWRAVAFSFCRRNARSLLYSHSYKKAIWSGTCGYLPFEQLASEST